MKYNLQHHVCFRCTTVIHLYLYTHNHLYIHIYIKIYIKYTRDKHDVVNKLYFNFKKSFYVAQSTWLLLET